MAHYADHCAACHANDGSGETELGLGLYPKPPDMPLPATQSLTDGELFYIATVPALQIQEVATAPLQTRSVSISALSAAGYWKPFM